MHVIIMGRTRSTRLAFYRVNEPRRERFSITRLIIGHKSGDFHALSIFQQRRTQIARHFKDNLFVIRNMLIARPE